MANNIEVIQAIIAIDSNADAGASGDPYDADAITLTWTSSEIPLADIKTKMAELQTEYDTKDYARKREAAYPATKDFMEAYTEKEIGGNSTKWDAYVINYNKVRTENPK